MSQSDMGETPQGGEGIEMSDKGETETPQGGEWIGMSDKGKTPQGAETKGIGRP